MKEVFKFETVNEWNSCTTAPGSKSIKRYSITTSRGRTIIGDVDMADWFASHQKALEHFNSWLKARECSVDVWKHDTPHERYDCDRASLSIRVNGITVLVRNGYGDGNFPVYIMEEKNNYNADKPSCDVLPYTFKPSSTMLEFDKETSLEIMDYDCDGAKPLRSITAYTLSFYIDGRGAVVVKYRK